MDDQALLAMLKANLEKLNSVNDPYLEQLIGAAKAEIKREGIAIADDEGVYSFDDANLIVMYASWLYRKRASNEQGYRTEAVNVTSRSMPPMLRYALNQRIFSGA